MVAPKAGIHQAFATADIMISQSVRSIVNLIQRPGLIRIGFDDLLAALRSRNGRCLLVLVNPIRPIAHTTLSHRRSKIR